MNADDKAKPRLGRGLSALLGEDTQDYAALDAVRDTKSVPIEHLRPNRMQPRRDFNEEEIDSLTESIEGAFHNLLHLKLKFFTASDVTIRVHLDVHGVFPFVFRRIAHLRFAQRLPGLSHCFGHRPFRRLRRFRRLRAGGRNARRTASTFALPPFQCLGGRSLLAARRGRLLSGHSQRASEAPAAPAR